ncbi:MAG: arsenic efflux protein [Clostridia bacterium]|nr:arsenic efflux protein [Clostridia bacterium]
MEGTWWEVLLDATLDTLKILPLLFLVYLLLEFLEFKQAFKFQNSKLLKGKASPVMGALFGSVPQCGFSIISTDLFTKQKLSIGALIAVYIATSDEALPIMISDYHNIPALLVLIGVKIVFAVLVGYLSMLLYHKVFFKKDKKLLAQTLKTTNISHNENEAKEGHHNHNHDVNIDNATQEIGCCHHDIQNPKFNWKHPIIHTLKILLFIFIINIIMGTIIFFVGEESLIAFLESGKALQPLLAVVIGLIPNCASSVVLTELYLAGGLSFGAIVAGLSVNAGLGLIFLFKQEKNIKKIIFVLTMLIVPSLILGYALNWIPIDLLSVIK